MLMRLPVAISLAVITEPCTVDAYNPQCVFIESTDSVYIVVFFVKWLEAA